MSIFSPMRLPSKNARSAASSCASAGIATVAAMAAAPMTAMTTGKRPGENLGWLMVEPPPVRLSGAGPRPFFVLRIADLRSSYRAVRADETVGTWEHGNMGTWGHGDMGTWGQARRPRL